MRSRFTLMLLGMLLATTAALLSTNVSARKEVRQESDLPIREEVRESYTLSPGARVRISHIMGPVEVETTEGREAELYIVRSAQRRADLDRFDRINIGHTPTSLVLRGEDSKSGGIEVRHRLRLRLPPQTDLMLHEVLGSVTINGAGGTVRLSEVNGAVDLTRVTGYVELEGVNGRVTLQVAQLGGRGFLLRDTGAVELRLAEGLNADLEMSELNDHPVVERPDVHIRKVGESSYRGRVGTGGAVISIKDVRAVVIGRTQ